MGAVREVRNCARPPARTLRSSGSWLNACAVWLKLCAVEIVPLFFVLGLIIGGSKVGMVSAVLLPVAFWAVGWAASDADLYGSGPLEPAFFVFVMVFSAAFALGGVALRAGGRRAWRRVRPGAR